MKASEVRDMSLDQLREKLTELKREQFNLRVQQATGQLENTTQRRNVRRDIARVSTILQEKEASGAQA
ncbi:MAG: 50S ribosomal protein L29 [Alphaproteobacteria bacterium]